jgi:hypothetical protein
MSGTSTRSQAALAGEQEEMHDLYRSGGRDRSMAPHVVYSEIACPHPGCGERLQAIDFRLEAHGRAVHDPLVTAWWNDTGFAGRCPHCRGWIHFTIRGKRAINDADAAQLPQLPDDWHREAVIL